MSQYFKASAREFFRGVVVVVASWASTGRAIRQRLRLVRIDFEHLRELFVGIVVLFGVDEMICEKQKTGNVVGVYGERRLDRLGNISLRVTGLKSRRQAAFHIGIIGKFFQPGAKRIGRQHKIMFIQGQLSGVKKRLSRNGGSIFSGAPKTILKHQSRLQPQQQQRLAQGRRVLAVERPATAFDEGFDFGQLAVGARAVAVIEHGFAGQQAHLDAAGIVGQGGHRVRARLGVTPGREQRFYEENPPIPAIIAILRLFLRRLDDVIVMSAQEFLTRSFFDGLRVSPATGKVEDKCTLPARTPRATTKPVTAVFCDQASCLNSYARSAIPAMRNVSLSHTTFPRS